jgi:hypothetical protein
VPNPTAASPLVAFKGGTSLAIGWASFQAPADVQRYLVLRDGTQVAEVKPERHNDFPEKDGKGWIDTNIVANQTYDYRVQVVDSKNAASDIGPSLRVTAPSELAAPPNISLDPGDRADLNNALEIGKAFLEIWYPKVAYAIADYPPTPAFTLRIDPQEQAAQRVADPPSILIGPNMLTSSQLDLGMFLHESTHVIQDNDFVAGWINEGVADWTREYMLHERDPKPIGPNDDYRDGYSPSSFFLNWAQTTYNVPLIKALMSAAHRRAYSSSIFTTQTGKSLGALWEQLTGRRQPTGPLQFAGMANKCVDGAGQTSDTGHAEVATCANSPAQTWFWGPENITANDGIIWLEGPGGCLDVENQSKEMGARVRTWACGRNDGQRWKLQPNGTLLHTPSGYCLDNPNGSTVDGTELRIWDCNGSSAQQFTLPQ